MDPIFEYVDDDGDRLGIRRSVLSESLIVDIDRGKARHTARLDRDIILSLHLALGEWLHPTDPGPASRTLEEALNRLTDAVNGAATAVRPLWSRKSEYVDASTWHSRLIGEVQDAEVRQVHRPQECPGAPECTEDVPACARCGHAYSDHEQSASRLSVCLTCQCTRYRSTS